ncbi:BREX-4 system phosphatase PglZ [Diplocloster hominis]|uniref:BREX-4 system phosphatase PglZ n=1 Tax=Diplocloster hominis TaxID=3079010 RepID=UPI0031BB8A0C
MDVGALKRKLIEDKEKNTYSYRRYPVRFLFMELNNNTQNEIEDLVKSSNGELLELSDYIMKKDDGWMTKSRFIQIIRNDTSQTKDTFVVGFSELIRFFSKMEIESTVLSLFDIENSNITDPISAQRRIYLICFSMKDNVYKVLQKSFARKDLIDPFINSDYELSGKYREICFVSSDYAANIKKNKITTSVEWIGLWRHAVIIDFTIPIWCCSESLYEWHSKASPDNAFQIDVVYNTKDYLQKAYSFEVEIPYEAVDEEYWEQLCTEYTRQASGMDMQGLVSHSLGIDARSTSALAGKFLTTESAYEKWLLKCYVVAYLPNTFLGFVLKVLKSYSKKEFLIKIWQQGYWIHDVSQLDERLTIIREINKFAGTMPPENEIQEVIYDGVVKELGIEIALDVKQNGIQLAELGKLTGRDIADLKDRLLSYYMRFFKPAFTGLSKKEKEFVINLCSNGILDKAEVKNVYPALYFYLYSQAENQIKEKDEFKFYMQAYRESKIADKDNPFLQRYYDDGCANSTNLYSMYYAIHHQEVAIEEYSEDSDIYILDGVGAEYLPLIAELLRMNEYVVEYCDYAVCHLPSITDINKDYLAAVPYKEWFLNFDREVIHGEFYKTAVNLRKAFDILEEKMKDITLESSGRRIVITADHGATARARWTDAKKKYNFSAADHEGRCCKVSAKSDYEDTNDYIAYEDVIKPGTPYVISLNDQSLYNRPRYEDHGGATIEEMLVPVIVAVPHDVNSIAYKVLEDKLEVSGLDKLVSFTIIPDPEGESYVIEADMSKHVLKKSGFVYSTELLSGKEQDITVVVADKEYEFRTKNRAKSNLEGDDGFDD